MRAAVLLPAPAGPSIVITGFSLNLGFIGAPRPAGPQPRDGLQRALWDSSARLGRRGPPPRGGPPRGPLGSSARPRPRGAPPPPPPPRPPPPPPPRPPPP